MRNLTRLILLAALPCVAACGGSSTTSTSSSTTPTTTAQGPAATKATFLGQIRQSIASSGLPADFNNCVVAKANAMSGSQIAALQAKGGTAANQLGRRFAEQCLAQGHGASLLRQKFVAGIRRAAARSNLSHAFISCLISKANAELSNAQLTALALSSLQPGAQGAISGISQSFGAKLARQCKGQGINP